MFFKKKKPVKKERIDLLKDLIDSLYPDKEKVAIIIQDLLPTQEKVTVTNTDTPILLLLFRVLLIGLMVLTLSYIFQM